MYVIILLIAALVILFLAVRVVMKFLEMSRWKDEDAVAGGKGKTALPRELRELNIEDPSDDVINPISGQDGKITSG